MIKRNWLVAVFVSSVAALVLLPVSAYADTYPSKPIRIIVPWPPGGATDVMARLVGAKLSERIGQPVVIENKAGAAGFIGTELAAKADPDGYTLLLATASTHTFSPQLFRNIPYDATADFTPISLVATGSSLLVAPKSLPANSIQELVALAKSKPGALNFASWGNGSSPHLAMELLMDVSGTKMTQIPYKGASPALLALVAGDIAVYFDSISSALPHVRSGKLKALGYAGVERTPAAPDIPTIAETYPGFEVTTWWGIVAPAKTPSAIVELLNSHLVKVVAMPEISDKLAGLGAAPKSSSPQAFVAHMAREREKWGRVIKKAGVPMSD